MALFSNEIAPASHCKVFAVSMHFLETRGNETNKTTGYLVSHHGWYGNVNTIY